MTAAARSMEGSWEPGTEIGGRYVVESQIGAGGAGFVFRVRDETLGRLVALKQLVAPRGSARGKTLEALFEREYYTLVRLKHPRIIEVYDYGRTALGPYYTMELLGGKDLNQLGRLPYREVCRHLRDVASSLALLHAQRLVHRDVSARNVRLTSDGRAKLLDFGALAPFGTATEVIGTPLCMAPEVLQQLPLDHRTDLYSLGTVAYAALTGHHPYPARTLRDLPLAWETPPRPPSALIPDIPAELDHLIGSLISLDPLGRPASAAEVIDRLTVIGELPAEIHDRAEDSYLSSSQMVGRQRELDWIRRRLLRARKGRGSEVLIEGPAGIGRSRLLNEAGLSAQLTGSLTLKADGETSPSNFGVAASLALHLLQTAPEIARRTAAPHVAVLAHLSPEIDEALGEHERVPLALDPADRRARFQTALREWFLAVAREQSMVIAVDNLHAADDNSAAFLAALGRDARTTSLVVAGTVRTGAPVAAEAALNIIRERTKSIKLAGLDATAVTALVRSLFGDVTNVGRMGRLLHDRSGGVPQQCMDLARLMVKTRIVRYFEGAWVLPLEVGEDELPSRVEEVLSARLSALQPASRDLLELLSVHEKPLPIEVVRALHVTSDEAGTYAALDDLVAEQFLSSEGTSYRFRQETAREAILSQMDAAARRAHHLGAAETLLAVENAGVGLRIDVALHLLEAGEEVRGAGILVAAAREFAVSSGTHDSIDQAVRALYRTVKVYEERGRSEHAVAALLFPLMRLAYYSSHWRYVLEYGERAVELGLRITGLSRAAELEPALGREAAMRAGLGAAMAEFESHAADGLGFDLKTAIASCCGMGPAIIGTFSTCLDTLRVKRITELMRPFSLFGDDHVAALVHEFALADELLIRGREAESCVVWEQSLKRHENPAIVQALGEGQSRSLQGGIMFSLGISKAYCFGGRALEIAGRMETLGVKTWELAADQVRLLYHAFRAEAEQVQLYRDRVELFAVQGNTTWQVEIFCPVLLLNADVLTNDTISARRTWEQLARAAKSVESLKPHAEAAHAAYLMLRGDPEGAIAVYERALPDFPVRERVGWETTRAYFARALNATGNHERAKSLVLEVLSNMTERDHDTVVHFLEAKRQLALAEAGLGNTVEAARILDGLLSAHGAEDNRLLVGLLHEARAEVALMANDPAAFELHCDETEKAFRSTKNPALVAECERLALRLPSTHEPLAAERMDLVTAVEGPRRAETGISVVVDEISVAADPYAAALQVVMQRTKAKAGYLYTFQKEKLTLASASEPNEPPRGLETQLLERVGADSFLHHDEEDDDMSHTMSIENGEAVVPPLTEPGRYQLIPLFIVDGKDRMPVGGFILEAKPQNVFRLAPELLTEMARVLHERRSDATSIVDV